MERTTSALMGSMPTRSSRPTAVSPGRISVCGDRPAPRKGAAMTAPSIRTMRMTGRAAPSQCGRWTVGKMPCPLTRADDDPARAPARRRPPAGAGGRCGGAPGPGPRRRCRRMESPTIPDTRMGSRAPVPVLAPASGAGWRLDGRPGTISAGRLMTGLRSSPVDVSNLENPTGPMTLRSDKSHKSRSALPPIRARRGVRPP